MAEKKEITLEGIAQKLGFDPMNPPKYEPKDPFLVDDATPSIWAPLNEEELAFLYEKKTGRKPI